MIGGFLAWLAVGGAFYVLHDPSMIMSRYKRGRGRGIVAETITGWTPFSTRRSCGVLSYHLRLPDPLRVGKSIAVESSNAKHVFVMSSSRFFRESSVIF